MINIYTDKKHLVDNDCDSCRHISICKYCDDLKLKKEHIEKIPCQLLSPIDIVIICRNFEKKNLKQDGVVFRKWFVLQIYCEGGFKIKDILKQANDIVNDFDEFLDISDIIDERTKKDNGKRYTMNEIAEKYNLKFNKNTEN